jgi:hypothetical protein
MDPRVTTRGLEALVLEAWLEPAFVTTGERRPDAADVAAVHLPFAIDVDALAVAEAGRLARRRLSLRAVALTDGVLLERRGARLPSAAMDAGARDEPTEQ